MSSRISGTDKAVAGARVFFDRNELLSSDRDGGWTESAERNLATNVMRGGANANADGDGEEG